MRRPPAPAAPPAPPGPGQETPYGIRVCNINDGVAEGTVMDGYRKVDLFLSVRKILRLGTGQIGRRNDRPVEIEFMKVGMHKCA